MVDDARRDDSDVAGAVADRLLEFAVRVVRLTRELPRDPAGRHIADQLFRAGTSPGALYQEARSAESRRDFLHKLTIALKELQEARYWLQLIGRAGLVSAGRLSLITREADELCKILGKSRATSKLRLNGRRAVD